MSRLVNRVLSSQMNVGVQILLFAAVTILAGCGGDENQDDCPGENEIRAVVNGVDGCFEQCEVGSCAAGFRCEQGICLATSSNSRFNNINNPGNNTPIDVNNTNNNLNNFDNGSPNNTTNNTTNNTDGGSALVPGVQAFQNCAAGGVMSGDGVSAINCTGPADTAGFEASGDGIVWQPGGASVILIQ